MLATIRRAFHEQGAMALLARAIAASVDATSLGRLRFVWYVLVAQPVDAPTRMPARLGRSVVIRQLQSGDPLLVQAPRPAAVLAERFSQGALCFAAIREDRLAGFLWLCPNRYMEDDVRCTFLLPENGVAWWDFDVWISPDQRNGVIFAKLWNAASEFLREVGAQWTCSRITRQNVASIDAHRRLGAMFVGHAVFIRGRSWQLSLARSPRIHLSRAASLAPVIPVNPPRIDPLREEGSRDFSR
jgi:hypothetical protein